MSTQKKSSFNKKSAGFLGVLTALAGLIGYVIPSPLGLELLFDYILGPTAFLIGFGACFVTEKKIKSLSIPRTWGSVAFIIAVLAMATSLYFWLYYNVASLDFWTLVFEIGSFAFIFIPLGLSVELAGLSLTSNAQGTKENKKSVRDSIDQDDEDENNDQNSDVVDDNPD